MIAKSPAQQLLLLPGEYEFLSSKGWLGQFSPFEHRVSEFPLDAGILKIESIVSRRPNCACNHDTRPTICRLYPLLPVFDVSGRLVGIDPLGIYEEMEALERISPACQITGVPTEQLSRFLQLTAELSRNVVHLFYLAAYRLAKRHIAARLAQQREEKGTDVFVTFENALLRQRLIDPAELRRTLNNLALEFRSHYGERFAIA